MRINNIIRLVLLISLVIILLSSSINAAGCTELSKPELKDLTSKIENTKKELDSLNDQAKARQAIDRAREFKDREMSSRLAALEARDREARRTLDPEDYESYSRISDLEKGRLQMQKRIDDLSASNTDRQAEINKAVKEINDLNKDINSKVEQRRKELQDQGRSQEQINVELSNYRRQLIDQEGLKQKAQALEDSFKLKTIRELGKGISELDAKLQQLRAENTAVESRQRYSQEQKQPTPEQEKQGAEAKAALDEATKKAGLKPEEVQSLFRSGKVKVEAKEELLRDKKSPKSKPELEAEVKDLKSQLDKDPTNREIRNKYKKADKHLRLEELIEKKKAEIKGKQESKAPEELINQLNKELNDLENTQEFEIKTGNAELDRAISDVMSEWEFIQNQKFRSDRTDSLFNVREKQAGAIVEFLKGGEITGIEFALAGGKTSTIVPLLMELGIRFNGRKGLSIFSDNKGQAAYEEFAIALAQMGRKGFFMKNSRPRFTVKDKKGKETQLSPEESLRRLVEKVKNADFVVTEVDQIGFAEATLKSGKASGEELQLYRELLDEISKNRQVTMDEAHLTADGKRQYRIGEGGESLSKKVIENTNFVGKILKNLGIIEKSGTKWNINTKGKLATQTIEGKNVEAGVFTKDFLRKIAEQVGKEKGIKAEDVIELFETKSNKNLKAEQVSDLLDVLETVNEFSSMLRNSKESNFVYDEVDGLIKPAHGGNAQFKQQLSRPRSAAAMEYLGAHVYGKTPRLSEVKSGGASVTASVTDFFSRVTDGANSQVSLMTGTIGEQIGSLQTGRRINFEQTSEIQEKMLGLEKDGQWQDGVMVKPDTIQGIGDRNFVDVLLGNSKLNSEARLAITVTEKGQSPKDIAEGLLRSNNFRDHSAIIKGADGKFKYGKLDPKTGEFKVDREITEEESATIMQNTKKKTLLILGEGASTGTNIKMKKDVRWVHFSSSKVSLDLQLQAFGRAERIAGEIPEVYVMVKGKEGIVSNKDATEMWKANQETATKENTYQAVREAANRVLDNFLSEIIRGNKEGSVKVDLARKSLLDYQSKDLNTRNLDIEPGTTKTLEQLQQTLESNAEFARKLLEDNAFTETLSKSELQRLQRLAEGPGKLDFAVSEPEGEGRSVFDAKDFKDFADLFKQTVTKDSVGEFTTGKDQSYQIDKTLESVRDTIANRETELSARSAEARAVEENYNNRFEDVRSQFRAGDTLSVGGVNYNIEFNSQGQARADIDEIIEQAIATGTSIEVMSNNKDLILNGINDLRGLQNNLDNLKKEVIRIATEVQQAQMSLSLLSQTKDYQQASTAARRVLQSQGYSDALINQNLEAAVSAMSSEQLRALAALGTEEYIDEEARKTGFAIAENLFFDALKQATDPDELKAADTSVQTPKIQDYQKQQDSRSQKVEDLLSRLRSIVQLNPELADVAVSLDLATKQSMLINNRETISSESEDLGSLTNTELRSRQLEVIESLQDQNNLLSASISNAYSLARELLSEANPENRAKLEEIIKSSESLFKELQSDKKLDEINKGFELPEEELLEEVKEQAVTPRAEELSLQIQRDQRIIDNVISEVSRMFSSLGISLDEKLSRELTLSSAKKIGQMEYHNVQHIMNDAKTLAEILTAQFNEISSVSDENIAQQVIQEAWYAMIKHDDGYNKADGAKGHEDRSKESAKSELEQKLGIKAVNRMLLIIDATKFATKPETLSSLQDIIKKFIDSKSQDINSLKNQLSGIIKDTPVEASFINNLENIDDAKALYAAIISAKAAATVDVASHTDYLGLLEGLWEEFIRENSVVAEPTPADQISASAGFNQFVAQPRIDKLGQIKYLSAETKARIEKNKEFISKFSNFWKSFVEKKGEFGKYEYKLLKNQLTSDDETQIDELRASLNSLGYAFDLRSIVDNSLFLLKTAGAFEKPVKVSDISKLDLMKNSFRESRATLTTPQGSYTPITINNIITDERTKIAQPELREVKIIKLESSEITDEEDLDELAEASTPVEKSIADGHAYIEAQSQLESIINDERFKSSSKKEREEAAENARKVIESLTSKNGFVENAYNIMTERGTTSSLIYEKILNDLIAGNKVDLTIINLPITLLNSIDKSYKSGDFVKKTLFERLKKELSAKVDLAKLGGESIGYLGTRIILTGLSKDDLVKVQQIFDDIINELIKNQNIENTKIAQELKNSQNKLKVYIGHTTINIKGTPLEREEIELVERQVIAEELVLDSIKDVIGTAETAEKFSSQIGKNILIFNEVTDNKLKQEIQSRRNKYVPPFEFTTGKLPRLKHNLGRITTMTVPDVESDLEQIITDSSKITDLQNKVKTLEAELRSFYLNSLLDNRFSLTFKKEAMQMIIDMHKTNKDALAELLKGSQISPGIYAAKLGDEISLVYEVDGRLIMTFIELDKFNAFNTLYTPDGRDSYYHTLIKNIINSAKTSGLDKGITREQNQKFVNEINSIIANTEILYDQETPLDIKDSDGKTISIIVTRDGKTMSTSQIIKGDQIKVKDMKFHETEKINGERKPQYNPDGTAKLAILGGSVTTDPETEVEDFNEEFYELGELNGMQKKLIGRGKALTADEVTKLAKEEIKEESITPRAEEIPVEESIENEIFEIMVPTVQNLVPSEIKVVQQAKEKGCT